MIDVVIPAAGVGKRMGCNFPKQYLKINGLTILEITLKKMLKLPNLGKIILVLNQEDEYFKELNIYSEKIVTTIGGKERSDSVLNGLKVASTEYVLVHDAARPLVDILDIEKLVKDCTNDDGGILAAKVADTIKKGNQDLSISETVDRSSLFRALTPQYFKTSLLINAYEDAVLKNKALTDEASAMELLGYHPKLVLSNSLNIKITEPNDLLFARLLMEKELV
ncbi:MAG: 2-C-methyl-D-erythritol 4-phosphate cytidylyltransferase [Succinivibrionaceae bacterium]|nr:2-C-methyl-D-erythritol 4-phosphate cytidylyltransferase [Succinivibrionaceae bacterium]